MMTGERIAQRLHERIVIEAFDGSDLGSVASDCVRDTASHRRPVDQHGAGAAHAVFAAEAGAGQAKGVADEIGQMRTRLDGRFDGAAVDGE